MATSREGKHSLAKPGQLALNGRVVCAACEAAQLAPEYITAITGREPERMTSVEPSDAGGWIVEAELVEDRRIPSSTDMLGLHEIELDADGELRACSRTGRYRGGEALSPMTDTEQTVIGDANGVGPK